MSADFATQVAIGLSEGRALAESLMTDTCTITRVDPDAPEPELDPVTLEYPPAARITVYSGKCQFQTPGILASNASTEAGERSTVIAATIVKLPHSDPTAGNVAPDDEVEIGTCQFNPSLEGRKPTIASKEPLKSQTTAHRFVLSEVAK